MDTNVVSELMRPRPADAVTDWVNGVPPTELCATAVTVAEVRYGVERLPEGRRKEALQAAAEDVFASYRDRLLPFDAAAAVHYAVVVCDREDAGRPIRRFDAQIAAICRAHRALLATRNTKDFEGTGVDLIDPWQGP